MPLVTCVCPTRNRRSYLARAIDCFVMHSYEPRELLVLDDDDTDPVGDLCPTLPPTLEGLRAWIVYRREPRRVFGAKRNRGMELATGQVVANWDDDDWSGRARLTDQVGRLLHGNQAVTGYYNMRFTD